eukprot:TRINITY_DN823_c0_g1_i1.p1 TRINITY_DN823_c0_g1~~TRINITY_DN823_c0_g1_i1.p1  ORF type:complete len:145 (+),score=38.59 TRINITY_DN823_c0_g1_i1:64-498(+)
MSVKYTGGKESLAHGKIVYLESLNSRKNLVCSPGCKVSCDGQDTVYAQFTIIRLEGRFMGKLQSVASPKYYLNISEDGFINLGPNSYESQFFFEKEIDKTTHVYSIRSIKYPEYFIGSTRTGMALHGHNGDHPSTRFVIHGINQ